MSHDGLAATLQRAAQRDSAFGERAAHVRAERGLTYAPRQLLLEALARGYVHRHAAHADCAPARVAHGHGMRLDVYDAPVLPYPAKLVRRVALAVELATSLGGGALAVFRVDDREPEVRSL
jgi:hypothetical protein